MCFSGFSPTNRSCMIDKVPLVSADSIFDQYGVNRLWK